MDRKNKTKKLLKILFGVAWIDGTIQPEERQYLHQMAQTHSLSDDPEIKTLLLETKPIVSKDCYAWLTEYLGENPSQKDFEELLESLSALIYSDGMVDIKEAKLLNYLEELEEENIHPQSSLDKLLNIIQRLYRNAIN